MRGSTPWCALLAAGLILGGCGQRRPIPPPPQPPPPQAPPASRSDGGLAALLGQTSIDGGLAGLAGIQKGSLRDPNHQRRYDSYPDWPRDTPLPPMPRGLVDLPSPPSTADASTLEFDRKLRVSKGLIRSCYERALRATPTLAGEVTLELTLGADGKVLSVATPSSSVGDEIPHCLRAQLPRLRFPPPSGGPAKRTVTVKLRPVPPDAGPP